MIPTLISFSGDDSYGTSQGAHKVPSPHSSSAPAAVPHSSQICQGRWIPPAPPCSWFVPSWLLASLQKVSEALLPASS